MKKNIVTLIFLGCFALTVSEAAAQNNIEDILSAIEENNVQLSSLRLENEASQLEIQAQNNLQQDISISYSPFFAAGVQGIASSELVVSMGFDFPSQYASRSKAGKLQTKALDRQYMAQRRDILLEAKQLCMDLVMLQKVRGLIEARLTNAQSLQSLTQKRFDEGGANIIEVNKVKMECMNLNALVAQNHAAVENTLQALQALNGNMPLEAMPTAYPEAGVIADFESFAALVMSTDASLASAAASVEAAAQEIKVNRQNWLPKFEVGYRRNTAMQEASHGFLVGASFPLFSSRNKTKIAQARYSAAQSTLADATIRTETAIKAQYNEMIQLQSALQVYDESLMNETLEALMKAVSNGQISILDYYVEADNIYNSLNEYFTLENSYHRLLSEIHKNTL